MPHAASPHDDAALELVLETLSRGHAVRMVARGSSMDAAIRDGDTIVLRPKDSAPALGDVVLVVDDERGMLIHRVLGTRRDGAVFVGGDATARPDGWFAPGAVRAVVEARVVDGVEVAVGPRVPRARPSLAARVARRLRRLAAGR